MWESTEGSRWFHDISYNILYSRPCHQFVGNDERESEVYYYVYSKAILYSSHSTAARFISYPPIILSTASPSIPNYDTGGRGSSRATLSPPVIPYLQQLHNCFLNSSSAIIGIIMRLGRTPPALCNNRTAVASEAYLLFLSL